jgi:hypothetical protein
MPFSKLIALYALAVIPGLNEDAIAGVGWFAGRWLGLGG